MHGQALTTILLFYSCSLFTTFKSAFTLDFWNTCHSKFKVKIKMLKITIWCKKCRVQYRTISVNKLPICPVSGEKRPPGLTVSHLVISLLSLPPCSASGPLSSILWLANQTDSHLRVSQGFREPCWGDMVTVTSNHEVNRKMPFLLWWKPWVRNDESFPCCLQDF